MAKLSILKLNTKTYSHIMSQQNKTKTSQTSDTLAIMHLLGKFMQIGKLTFTFYEFSLACTKHLSCNWIFEGWICVILFQPKRKHTTADFTTLIREPFLINVHVHKNQYTFNRLDVLLMIYWNFTHVYTEEHTFLYVKLSEQDYLFAPKKKLFLMHV